VYQKTKTLTFSPLRPFKPIIKLIHKLTIGQPIFFFVFERDLYCNTALSNMEDFTKFSWCTNYKYYYNEYDFYKIHRWIQNLYYIDQGRLGRFGGPGQN
jgi:hypothetical protein